MHGNFIAKKRPYEITMNTFKGWQDHYSLVITLSQTDE